MIAHIRMDNAAEKLFSELADKNGDSYEGLIQGLVKVNHREKHLCIDSSSPPPQHIHTVQAFQEGIQGV